MTKKGQLSALQIGIIWQRINGLLDETAQVFVRTSFSSVVRDNWDFALCLMDSEGRSFSQSSRSIPSFIGSMPRTLRVMLQRFPKEKLKPGDVMISNDAYHGTCLLYTSPSPRDQRASRMPSST